MDRTLPQPGPGSDQPVLLWFTRDLRLHDQPALRAAVATGRRLVACYVLDDAAEGRWGIGGASRWWLHGSLSALDSALRELGASLVLRRGDIVAHIAQLAREVGAAEVHVGQPIEPAGRAAVDRLEPALATHGCRLHRHWTTLLFDPESLRTQSGSFYNVYTPFSKACLARGLEHGPEPAPDHILAAAAPSSERLEHWGLLPTRPDWAGGFRQTWAPGEPQALRRLRDFVGGELPGYAAARNTPGVDGVSQLSPSLHFGEVSPRAVWQAASGTPGKGAQSYINELLWREFCAHLLWHHPTLPDEPLRTQFNEMSWRNDDAELAAWRQGRTGIPIVDAGMRQMWHIGWQHNRVRLITASFLIKHLLTDWRIGEAWFWDCLVDADLASNSANWQWVAGCGADASPFFRIFNPWLQGQKFDPDGTYVKRWVPELSRLEARYIHSPWEAPEHVLQTAGIELGASYPRPIVDLMEGRNRALEAFRHVSNKIRL